MTSDARAYEILQQLFEEASELEGPAREAFLTEACGDNAKLRAEVEELLQIAEEEGSSDPFSDVRIEESRSALESIVEEGGFEWVPERIGDYEIVRRIGAGGMGVVYEALQESPRRRVAIKLLNPMQVTKDRLRRFRQEAEVLGKLQHPGIAQIFEAGTFDAGHGPQPFFAMELVDGVDLKTFCEREQLSPAKRMKIIEVICDAVQHAHDRGVIHRDLKPDNVLVDEHGQPKILDFGIARADTTDVISTILTEEGQIVGTLAYMAPEQLESNPETVTAAVDVHALGVVLYELLTGRLPREVDKLPPAAAIAKLSNADAPRAGKVNPGLRGDIETILGKALEVESDRRYASASALGKDIRLFLDARPIEARKASGFYRVQKFARRNRSVVVGLAATFVTLIAGYLVVSSLSLELDQQRTQADEDLVLARERVSGPTRVVQMVQAEIEAGNRWKALEIHGLIREEERSWGARLQLHALPWVLDLESLDWEFVGEHHIVACGPDMRHLQVVSLLKDEPPRALFEGVEFARKHLKGSRIARDGKAMAVLTDNRTALIDVFRDEVLEVFPDTSQGMISPDGHTIALVSTDGSVRFRIDGEWSDLRPEVGESGWAMLDYDGSHASVFRGSDTEILNLATGESLLVQPREPYEQVTLFPLGQEHFLLSEGKWPLQAHHIARREGDALVIEEFTLAPGYVSVISRSLDGKILLPSLNGHTIPVDRDTLEPRILSHWQERDSGRINYAPTNGSWWARVSPGRSRFMLRGPHKGPWIGTFNEREADEDYDPRCLTIRSDWSEGASVRASADGSSIAWIEEGEARQVFDAITGEPVSGALDFESYEPSTPTYSIDAERNWLVGEERSASGFEQTLRTHVAHPTQSLVAVGTEEGRILLVEPELMTVEFDFDAHESAVTSLAWMPDGERLISASTDGLVRIWDPRSRLVREQEARAAKER